MGLDIDSLRNRLRKATGTDDVDMPDEDADLYLNTSYWELLDKFPFREKEVKIVWNTVAGVKSYNVPQPFEALKHLALKDSVSNKHVPLDQMGHDVYEQDYDEDSDDRGQPTRYVREGKQIILFPTPDVAYSITMRYWTVLSDIGQGQNPEIPQSWHETILYGGIWRAFIDLGDHQRATSIQRIQATLINSSVPVEAKEEENNPRAGLEVLGRDRDYLG